MPKRKKRMVSLGIMLRGERKVVDERGEGERVAWLGDRRGFQNSNEFYEG